MAYQECLSTVNYSSLNNLPKIGHVTLNGDISPSDLGLYGGGDTLPIGTIISYMGKTAPVHYLSCDGTIYNIADYQTLADFIKNQFGSYNFFGGDGVTTFAVPDLRGEFLRGTGTNSHANSGNGSAVGVHQSATKIPDIFVNSYNGNVLIGLQSVPSGYTHTESTDSYIKKGTETKGYQVTLAGQFDSGESYNSYTTRPTNTSVLWCIKYEMANFNPNTTQAGFTPCGSIISYFGETAPENYLACDGAEYYKKDYPDLWTHLSSLSNNTPYISSDNAKFKVPDLRGEFLRGTGTNGHAKGGDGAGVGVHQDPTTIRNGIFVKGNSLIYCTDTNDPTYMSNITNPDKAYGTQTQSCKLTATYQDGSGNDLLRSTRPTNTSVLYCIAVKDLYVDRSTNYSTEEKRIGTWIDGKPLYQKTITCLMPNDITDGQQKQLATPHGISNIKDVIETNGQNGKSTFSTWGAESSIRYTSGYADESNIYLRSNRSSVSGTSWNVTIRYTKTTD